MDGPRHVRVREFLAGDAARGRTKARAVAESVRTGEPVTVTDSPWIAEADTFWAIDALDQEVSTGQPYYAGDRVS